MIKKYFTRKFRTLRGIKFAIFLKRYYDRIRLKIEGKTILQQEYGINTNWITNEGKRYYTIFNQIWTQEAVDDLRNHVNQDVEAMLVEKLKENHNE